MKHATVLHQETLFNLHKNIKLQEIIGFVNLWCCRESHAQTHSGLFLFLFLWLKTVPWIFHKVRKLHTIDKEVLLVITFPFQDGFCYFFLNLKKKTTTGKQMCCNKPSIIYFTVKLTLTTSICYFLQQLVFKKIRLQQI